MSLAGMGIGSAVWPFDESGESVFIGRFARWAATQPAPTITCVDVGANEGGYAELLLDAVGPRGEVHCFEPASETVASLRRRLALRDGATVHGAAVGATAGTVVLHTVPGHSQLASLHGFADRDVVEERVPVVTMDDWALQQGVTHVHLMKVDVEGAEADVLQGATALLGAGAIDIVQFEFGARNLRAGGSLRDLYDLLPGYRIHRLVVDGLHPLGAYRETLEIPISATNFVAVRDGVGDL